MNEEVEEFSPDADVIEKYDERFLVAALMVFVARGDGAISQNETEKMLMLIGERFGLSSGATLAGAGGALATLAAR